ncbi:hypothetical protein FBD94_08245 [Pedobacter hiemivivus]|uniref:Uncharacterized protein n=1 Tax=Pedobacter hiemivivus TaxID=2530454 RepID=A0A4U1GKW1_9SPHI|nr:hypothetical protein [Pedobacter hiemivivus]TKC62202.1 hypothetical protein FBD94_08245 [Pedobacter hiemivivus]
MKKNLLYILAVIIVSFTIILSIHGFNQNNENNGFTRIIKEQHIKFTKAYQLPPTVFYFAGISPTELHLKNLNDPSGLYLIDFALSKLKWRNLKLSTGLKAAPKQVTISVRDTTIAVTDDLSGNLTLISKITGKGRKFKGPEIWINQTSLISGSSLIGKNLLIKGEQPQRQLVKINYLKGKVKSTYQIEKQTDGFFCTDGYLQFDQMHSKLFYMYFYRGEFLCLDTNMKLLYKSKTIDTVTTAVVKAAKVTKNKVNTFTQSTPPNAVNRVYTLCKNELYIASLLKADNEQTSNFKENQIIDVYNMDSGKYQYSFYLPKYNGVKLRDFRISGNLIFAIYGTLIVRYELDPLLLT